MSEAKQQDSLDVAPEVAYEIFWREMLFDRISDGDILRLVENHPQEPAA